MIDIRLGGSAFAPLKGVLFGGEGRGFQDGGFGHGVSE